MKSTTLNAERHRLDRAEMLLIRSGQHLFREWRAKGRTDKDLEASFELVWELKRAIRKAQGEIRAKLRHGPKRGVPAHA